MIRRSLAALLVAASLFGGAALSAAAETPTPTPTPTPTGSPTPSSTETPSPTSSASPTPTPSPTPLVGSDGGPVPASGPLEDAPALRVSSELIALGEWITARSRGNEPGEKVQFVLYRGPIIVGSFVADENGTAIAQFQLPDETRPGIHVLESTGWESEHVANVELNVVAPTTSTAPGMEWMIVVGAVLLLALIALGVAYRDVIRRAFSGEPAPEDRA